MPARPSPSTAPLVAFHLGEVPDDRGRFIAEILGWDRARLERTHDYIQWLFPLATRSGANPTAPVLDAGQIAAFRADPRLRASLERAFATMTRFFGLKAAGEGAALLVRPGPDYERVRGEWQYPGSHNFLRITRMLTSLRTLGLEGHARAFHACLAGLRGRPDAAIDDTAFAHWNDAMK